MGSIGRNLPRIKEVNQFLIRENIYRNGPVSRNEVAGNLGLTLPTITTNISSMLNDGLLREIPVTTEKKTLGRHTMLVDFVPESRKYLGVEIRDGICRVVLVDLRGNILGSFIDVRPVAGYNAVLDRSAMLCSRILSECGMTADGVSAVGLCVPKFHFEDKKFGEDFAVKLCYRGPVYVESNAVARAYGLSLFNHGTIKGVTSLAYVFVNSIISCSILTDAGERFGKITGEGEIGHNIFNPDGPPCEHGYKGCLEYYSGELSILNKVEKALVDKKASVLEGLLRANGKLTMDLVLEAQRSGDKAVTEIIDEAVRYLGIAIHNISNIIKPDCFVIESKLFSTEENREKLKNRTGGKPEPVFLDFDDLGGARGAAACAVKADLESV